MNAKDQAFALSGCTIPGDAKLNAFARDIWGAAWDTAVKVEREACAKVCDELKDTTFWKTEKGRYNDCAVAIRARSKT